MKSALVLLFAVVSFGSSNGRAARPCTADDYGMIEAKVFSCRIEAAGGAEEFAIYSSSLGLRVDTGRGAGSFQPGARIVTLDQVQCPERPFDGVSEPNIRNGLSISIDPQTLPTVGVKRQGCKVTRFGSNEGGDLDWKFDVDTNQELIGCRYVGKTSLRTKQPGLDVCGFPNDDY